MTVAKAQTRALDDRIRCHRHNTQSRNRRGAAKLRHLRQVGLRILAIPDSAYEALEQWLPLKLPHVDQVERDTLLTQIADEFISLDVDSINLMLEPIAKHETSLLKEAKAAAASCGLRSWVCHQNVAKGVAPTVGAILRQRSRMEPIAQSTVNDNEGNPQGRSASYKWIARWRSKWHMPKAKIQGRDVLSPPELREKAKLVSCPTSNVA